MTDPDREDVEALAALIERIAEATGASPAAVAEELAELLAEDAEAEAGADRSRYRVN